MCLWCTLLSIAAITFMNFIIPLPASFITPFCSSSLWASPQDILLGSDIFIVTAIQTYLQLVLRHHRLGLILNNVVFAPPGLPS